MTLALYLFITILAGVGIGVEVNMKSKLTSRQKFNYVIFAPIYIPLLIGSILGEYLNK